MSVKILCGSACVKYVLEKYEKKNFRINNNLIWISEIAYTIQKKQINIKLLSYKSNLYIDYKNNNSKEHNFHPFVYFDKLNKMNINVIEKKISKTEIVNELSNNNIILLCVESKIFNNDKNMKGGHYIILNKIRSKKIVEIVNPVKQNYEIKYMSIKKIIKCCRNYGSWRIIIYGG